MQCPKSGKNHVYQTDLDRERDNKNPWTLKTGQMFYCQIAFPTGGKTEKNSQEDNPWAKKFTPEDPEEEYLWSEAMYLLNFCLIRFDS